MRDITVTGILTEPITESKTPSGRKVSFFVKNKKENLGCYAYDNDEKGTTAATQILRIKPGEFINAMGFNSDDGRNIVTAVSIDEDATDASVRIKVSWRGIYRNDKERKELKQEHEKAMQSKGYVRMLNKDFGNGVFATSFVKASEAKHYGVKYLNKWYSFEAYEKIQEKLKEDSALDSRPAMDPM